LASSWLFAYSNWQSAHATDSLLREQELIFRQAIEHFAGYLGFLFSFHLTMPFYIHRL